MIQHPEITQIERTGYPSWMVQESFFPYCDECGNAIENEVYEDREHSTLCLDCLKMLHIKE